MKPTITWIVLADAQILRVVVNDGPGKGVYGHKVAGLAVPKVTALSDAPGMTKAVAGPHRGSITDPDLKRQAEMSFADDIVHYLEHALGSQEFDRLVLVAAPQMLGILRQKLSASLQEVLYADLDKDLTHVALDALPSHLSDVLAA